MESEIRSLSASWDTSDTASMLVPGIWDQTSENISELSQLISMWEEVEHLESYTNDTEGGFFWCHRKRLDLDPEQDPVATMDVTPEVILKDTLVTDILSTTGHSPVQLEIEHTDEIAKSTSRCSSSKNPSPRDQGSLNTSQ